MEPEASFTSPQLPLPAVVVKLSSVGAVAPQAHGPPPPGSVVVVVPPPPPGRVVVVLPPPEQKQWQLMPAPHEGVHTLSHTCPPPPGIVVVVVPPGSVVVVPPEGALQVHAAPHVVPAGHPVGAAAGSHSSPVSFTPLPQSPPPGGGV